MKKVITVKNMRKSDAYTIANLVPSKELMYRAGKGAFEEMMAFYNGMSSPVAIVCGSGNNAGDGYVIAQLLSEAGIKEEIILLKEKFSEDGQFYFDKCVEADIPYSVFSAETDLSQYEYVVDCILGTGFTGDVRGTAAEVIEAINKVSDSEGTSSSDSYHAPKVISIDINSGLNGDTGTSNLAIKSDLTISVGYYKIGHFKGDADRYIKNITNVDIGIQLIDKPILIEDFAKNTSANKKK